MTEKSLAPSSSVLPVRYLYTRVRSPEPSSLQAEQSQHLLFLLHFASLFLQCELHSAEAVLLEYLEVLST